MTDDIEIRDFEGFKIFYRSWKRQFVGKKGEIELEAPDEETLQVLIKKQNTDQRKFKPIEVIRFQDVQDGRITSRAAHEDGWIYFSYKDSEGQPKHSKEFVGHHTWESLEDKAQPKFVELSEKNRQVLADIRKEQEAIQFCKAAIEKLKAQFEKPLNWKTLEQAVGSQIENAKKVSFLTRKKIEKRHGDEERHD